MAKTQSLDSSDLEPRKPHPLSASAQRGTVPSAELVPLQFRMPPAFVKSFKQAALDRDMKLNELLETIFHEFMKSSK
jgi:hypothetical protein